MSEPRWGPGTDLEELPLTASRGLPRAALWTGAFLVGVALMGLLIGTVGLFRGADADATPSFEAGFAAGSRAGAIELDERLRVVDRVAFGEGLRAAAAAAPPRLGSSEWIRRSVPLIDASISGVGGSGGAQTSRDAYDRGYRDGLRAARAVEGED